MNAKVAIDVLKQYVVPNCNDCDKYMRLDCHKHFCEIKREIKREAIEAAIAALKKTEKGEAK